MPKRGRSPADVPNADEKRVKVNPPRFKKAGRSYIKMNNAPVEENQVASTSGHEQAAASEPVAAESTADKSADAVAELKAKSETRPKAEPIKDTVANQSIKDATVKEEVIKDATVKKEIIKDTLVKKESMEAEPVKSVTSHSPEKAEDEIDYDDFDLDLGPDLGATKEKDNGIEDELQHVKDSDDATEKVDSAETLNTTKKANSIEKADSIGKADTTKKVDALEKVDSTEKIDIAEKTDTTEEIGAAKKVDITEKADTIEKIEAGKEVDATKEEATVEKADATKDVDNSNNKAVSQDKTTEADAAAEAAAAAAKALEEEEAAEKKAAEVAALMAHHAREAVIYGIRRQLEEFPQLGPSLGLNQASDTTTLTFVANGLKYTMTFSLVGKVPVEEQGSTAEESANVQQETAELTEADNTSQEGEVNEEQTEEEDTRLATTKPSKLSIEIVGNQKLRDATPLTNTPTPQSAALTSTPNLSTTPCKFGEKCSRRETCPYDHTQPYVAPAIDSKKPCGFVNSFSCNKGDECPFSHHLKDIGCRKAEKREDCTNYRCAYKHKDDHDGVQYASAAIRDAAVAAQEQREAAKLEEAAKAKHEAAIEQAERETAVAESLGLGPVRRKTPVPAAPAGPPAGPPAGSFVDPAAGTKTSGVLGKGAGQKRDRDGDGEEVDGEEAYLAGRPGKPKRPQHQHHNSAQSEYQNGGYGYQQNGYGYQQGFQQQGYQPFGNQGYGNQQLQQYGNPQHGFQQSGQHNGYQYNNGHQHQGRGGARGRGRGRGNGQFNNGRGRGNARQNSQPRAELKIKGTAAQHNP